MADLRVRSEIAGSVWKIEVAVGDTVAEDDPLTARLLRALLA